MLIDHTFTPTALDHIIKLLVWYPHAECFCNFVFRDEAEMEYLKIAQDLDMYGVSYFPITVSQ